MTGLQTSVPDGLPGGELTDPPSFHGVLGPVWMDACFFVTAPTSELLESRLCRTIGIVLDSCRSHGMSPNCQPGKTEAILLPSGKGSRSLRSRFFGPISSQKLLVVGEHQSDEIQVVGQYQHLGGVIQHSGKLHAEIKRRLAIAHSSFALHRKLLYQNDELSWHQRRSTFQSVVLSKLTYGAESWLFLDARSERAFTASVFRLYRRLLKLKPTDKVSDQEVLFRTELPSPSTLLRKVRLKYYGHLFRRDAVDWGLIASDSAWISRLKEDMSWMWHQLSTSSPLRDPEHHQEQ